MKTLSTEHRRQLERTVVEARDIAEAGAREALKALAVDHHEPYAHMTGEQRKLRNRLRAHARHLGDRVNARSGFHTIDHLVHECAYEHWHGMLFARFLAENHLLIEPEMGVAITLAECEELAKEEGVDEWVLAARFAHSMLPQVFRPDHPVFEVRLAREFRLKLEELVKRLSQEVFEAMDSLGWVYQFWQTKKKVEVNRAGSRVGAEELPAVTQLFTDDYMVDFLLQNTIGAWWACRQMPLVGGTEPEAKIELALPAKANIPGLSWPLLRLMRDEVTGTWRPIGAMADDWPSNCRDLRVLDPCMGSGHFLVFAFPMLVRLRMEQEALGEREAVVAVLEDNLFGLELDPRCTQIATFNLAFSAWKLAGYQPLPPLQLACCGQAPRTKLSKWMELAGESEQLRRGMSELYRLFQQAPILGSLLEPHVPGDLLTANSQELTPLLARALRREVETAVAQELALAAHGILKASEILTKKYHLLATNVPYLGRNDQSSSLKRFCEDHYPDAQTELATVFLERMLTQAIEQGTVAVVVPRIWLTYTAYYRGLRRKLLESTTWQFLAVLGKRAFEAVGGEIVDVVLLALSRKPPVPSHKLAVIDAAECPTPKEKRKGLISGEVHSVGQTNCLNNPGHVVLASIQQSGSGGRLLSEYVTVSEGISRGDVERFDRRFWELPSLDDSRWQPMVHSATIDEPYGGTTTVFLWDGGQGAMARSDSARLQGRDAWGKDAVFISRTHLRAFLSNGLPHAQNGVAVVPIDSEDLPAIWAYINSDHYRREVLQLSQKLIKPTGVLDKVPFDQKHWRAVASRKFPCGLPKPGSASPDQIYFAGRIRDSSDPLQVAVARLLGYRWPKQSGYHLRNCHSATLDDLEDLEDTDGIVCIPPVRGESAAVERLLQVLHRAWGADWNDGVLDSLLTNAGARSLEDWLRNKFFSRHCKLFQNRPFVWHIWDGRKHDGFHALVSYHKLAETRNRGRRVLESLTYSYLGDWMSRLEDGVRRGEEASEERLEAARALQGRLVAIMEGEPPFDIFVRWKPLREQPIGWTPDIEDGVRVNIRPFIAQDLAGGKKGAGVLRDRPNLSWGKDKGKEPERDKVGYPWLWKDSKFLGDRVNACHLTLQEKERARGGSTSP